MSSAKRDSQGNAKTSAGGSGIVIDLTKDSSESTLIDLSTERHGNTQKLLQEEPKVAGHTCGICLETVSEQGILDACDHAFCFDCIFKWSKTANTCPMCKRSFATLTPKMLDQAKPSKKKRRAIYRIKEKKQQYEYTPEELAALADAQEEEESDELGFDEYQADGWLVMDDDDLWSTDSSDFQPRGDPHRDELDELLFEARFVSPSSDSDSEESDFLEDLIRQLPRPAPAARLPTRAPAPAPGAGRRRGHRGRRGQGNNSGAGRLIPADVLATLRRPRRFGIRR